MKNYIREFSWICGCIALVSFGIAMVSIVYLGCLALAKFVFGG